MALPSQAVIMYREGCSFNVLYFLQRSPLSATQLLWVNLIMDSLASFALTSDPPSNDVLRHIKLAIIAISLQYADLEFFA